MNAIRCWQTYDPMGRREDVPALVTVGKSGLYLNRVARMLLPKDTTCVLVRHDPLHGRLRVERCRKGREGAMRLQGGLARPKGGVRQARVSGLSFNAWLLGLVKTSTTTRYRAMLIDGGIEIDLGSEPLSTR